MLMAIATSADHAVKAFTGSSQKAPMATISDTIANPIRPMSARPLTRFTRIQARSPRSQWSVQSDSAGRYTNGARDSYDHWRGSREGDDSRGNANRR